MYVGNVDLCCAVALGNNMNYAFKHIFTYTDLFIYVS
jgi:hypothetical protein